MKFWTDDASYPYQSHELWFLTENQRWGKLPPGSRHQGDHRQGQPRGHLAQGGQEHLGAPRPTFPRPRSRGMETFFDGKVFDPANPKAYLASLQIKKVA